MSANEMEEQNVQDGGGGMAQSDSTVYQLWGRGGGMAQSDSTGYQLWGGGEWLRAIQQATNCGVIDFSL